MGKSNEIESKSPNMIGAGTKIIGNIETNGDIRIDGEIVGNLDSKGKVVIGPNGKVKGEIVGANAELSGQLEGKIKISELLSLRESSKVYGDITTQKLTIEPGAIFTGRCFMGDAPGKPQSTPPPPQNGKKQ